MSITNIRLFKIRQEAHSNLEMSIGIGYGNEIMLGHFSARPYYFLCRIVPSC